MTEKRPALQRTHTRKTEDARKAALDEGVKITYDGEDFVVKVGDVTAQIARRFRREVGVSFQKVIEELSSDPDIDSIAALVWLARLLRGDDTTLDDVAISYSDLDQIEVAETTPEDESDPEA
jgi:hypothetical protein